MSRTVPVLVAVWLVIAAFTAYLVSGVLGSRRATEERVRGEALSYARLAAQHASAAFDRADMALVQMIDHIRPDDLTAPLSPARRRQIESLLVLQQQRSAGVVATYLTGPDGRIAAISLGAQPGTDLGDREYFQTVKRQNGGAPVISEAVFARVSKTWGTMIARRIDRPDGTFAGMAGANLGLSESFLDFYATLALGKDSTVSLRDVENRLLVRFPVAEERLGKQLAPGSPLYEHLRALDEEGLDVTRSSIDGVERVFGFRRLTNYPVYAIVGLSLEDALSGWKRQRDIVIVAIALVILAGAFITSAMRRQQRAENRIRELNETLEGRVRQRTDELASANTRLESEIAERKRAEDAALRYADNLGRMTHRTIKLVEEERRRLARELHDRVSSNLTAIVLNLENIGRQLSAHESERFGAALADCGALAADSAASARDISSDLHPAILDYMGIVAGLRDLGEKFARRTGVNVDVQAPERARRLAGQTEIALFRIAQEALVNISKHADAASVQIRLEDRDGGIRLCIRDDGRGFDPAQIGEGPRAPGLGLLAMQERAQAVGGSCRIESAPGHGTRVMVEIAA